MKITKDRIIHYATFSLISLTFLSGLFLSYFSTAHATNPVSTTAYATVHVSEACTLSANITSAHYIAMDNGTYEDDIGSTKFTVKCNDPSGFALYAIGYSNEKYGNTNMLGQATSLTIPTGTDTTLGNTASHWSMKVTKDTTSYVPANLTINNGFDSYRIVPEDYTKVATYTTSTDGASGTGSSVIATYDARISALQVADTYIGKVKFTLVHPSTSSAPVYPLDPKDAPANTIVYAPNAPDIEGTMEDASNSYSVLEISPTAGVWDASSNSQVTLMSSNFSRPGYGFAGWSTDFEATTSSVIYGPSEEITTGDLSNGMILYPVWVASTGTLQDWNGCGSLTPAPTNGSRATLSSVTALTDTRDGNVYAVAKLADGRCWMIENLRLDAENSVGEANITRAVGYENTATYGNFVGLADSETSTFAHSTTTANSLYSTDGSNNTINIGSSSANNRLPRYNNINTDREVQSATQREGSWYSYGNYYNWPAAIASTNLYTEHNYTVTGTSICPSGWHLPQGGGFGEYNFETGLYGPTVYGDFYNLSYAIMGVAASEVFEDQQGDQYPMLYYDGTTTNTAGDIAFKAFLKFPNNYIYTAGKLGSNSTNPNSFYIQRGSSTASYWSSTVGDEGDAYNLYFYISNPYGYVLIIDKTFSKNNAMSVRCIADERMQ